MTTASSSATQRRRYRSNAFTTTPVTVVPSAFALSTAARHTSLYLHVNPFDKESSAAA